MTPNEQRSWLVDNCVTNDASTQLKLSNGISQVAIDSDYDNTYTTMYPFRKDVPIADRKSFFISYFAKFMVDTREKRWVLTTMVNFMNDAEVNALYYIMAG